MIQTFGWPNTSRTYALEADQTLWVLEVDGRKTYGTDLKLDTNRFDDLLKVAESAHEEIKHTQQRHDLADGAFIWIVLNGNTNDEAVLTNYSKSFYSTDHLEALFKILHEIVPLSLSSKQQ